MIRVRLKRAYKYSRFLYHQRFVGFEVPDAPHFDGETTAFFISQLNNTKRYLEYGSGGSTILVSQLRIPGMSIENDRFYAKAVRKKLTDPSTVELIAVDIGLAGPWGRPVQQVPTRKRVQRWRRYVERPFLDSTELPDFVLVDGRFRRACALEVTRQSQSAGQHATIMIDDYYNRGRSNYEQIEALLGAPQRIGRSAVFQTADAHPISASAVEEACWDFS